MSKYAQVWSFIAYPPTYFCHRPPYLALQIIAQLYILVLTLSFYVNLKKCWKCILDSPFSPFSLSHLFSLVSEFLVHFSKVGLFALSKSHGHGGVQINGQRFWKLSQTCAELSPGKAHAHKHIHSRHRQKWYCHWQADEVVWALCWQLYIHFTLSLSHTDLFQLYTTRRRLLSSFKITCLLITLTTNSND